MNNKLLITILAAVILFSGIFTVFITVVNAKNCSKAQNLTVTMKNETDMDKAKKEISKLPKIKIIKITDRTKEWSRMVNKMDLPKMENPFKNEFVIKTKKNANIDEIYNQIKEMDFVENIEYTFDEGCTEKQK